MTEGDRSVRLDIDANRLEVLNILVSTGSSNDAATAATQASITSIPPPPFSITTKVYLQLFANPVARSMDRSINKPRNLAKSVTVE